MQARPPDDTDLVHFDVAAGLQPYLDAATAVARDAAAAGTARSAERVRALGLPEVLAEFSADDARGLLFQSARVLAHADPAAAWIGLGDAASALLASAPGTPAGPVALPDGDGGWRVHLAAPRDAARVQHLDPSTGWLLPASPAAAAAWTGACAQAPELAAFAGTLTCTLQATPAGGAPARTLSAAVTGAYAEAELALLGGLIVGATQRLADEAYAYAQQRQSAGRPISQHQAVALRLADMSINQQALALYLEAMTVQGTAVAAAHAGFVLDSACGVARDALQTAAGHGYVDGLPFMRLYQQVHTLCALLAAQHRALATSTQPAGCA